MATWITICDTCKREGWTPEEGTPPPGTSLAELVESAALGTPVRTRRTSCLMGCDHGCNVAVQAPAKLAYTLGRFEPSPEAAEAIVAWAMLHAESATGQVPYKLWPQPVKGHFVTRHPPLPEDA
jgi:predicted metal-binding protein